jgi:hypothetical protein
VTGPDPEPKKKKTVMKRKRENVMQKNDAKKTRESPSRNALANVGGKTKRPASGSVPSKGTGTPALERPNKKKQAQMPQVCCPVVIRRVLVVVAERERERKNESCLKSEGIFGVLGKSPKRSVKLAGKV